MIVSDFYLLLEGWCSRSEVVFDWGLVRSFLISHLREIVMSTVLSCHGAHNYNKYPRFRNKCITKHYTYYEFS